MLDPSLTLLTCGSLYRPKNVGVGSAAAQVSGQIVTDLIRSWLRVPLEQLLGHQNEPRRAKAALERAVRNKGFLDRMEFVAGAESLDSKHFSSIDKSR